MKKNKWNIYFKIISIISYLVAFLSISSGFILFIDLLNGVAKESISSQILTIIIYGLLTYLVIIGARSLYDVKKIVRKNYITSLLLLIPILIIFFGFIFGIYDGITSTEKNDLNNIDENNIILNNDPEKDKTCKAICEGHTIEEDFYYSVGKYVKNPFFTCFCYDLSENLYYSQVIE